MEPHLEIEFGHLSHDGPAEAAAREGLAALQRACPAVSACHVTLAGPVDGHHLCQPLCVQLRFQVAGATLTVNQTQQCGDSLEATVRRAFGAAHGRLLDWTAGGMGAAAAEGGRHATGAAGR